MLGKSEETLPALFNEYYRLIKQSNRTPNVVKRVAAASEVETTSASSKASSMMSKLNQKPNVKATSSSRSRAAAA